MLIPFDILVIALGACSKERLSNSFYKSYSLCCRRTNIHLFHIYILVPALGGAWKVEQPLEALPSSLHPVHWFITFPPSSYMQKIELLLPFSTGNLTAVGKLEEPEEQEEILKTSGLARIGSLRVSRPLSLSLSFEARSDDLTLGPFIERLILDTRRPTSFCFVGSLWPSLDFHLLLLIVVFFFVLPVFPT